MGERRSEPRLPDLKVMRLREIDEAAEPPLLLGLVVDQDFSKAVVEKGIAEPFDDGRPISLGLSFMPIPANTGSTSSSKS